MPPLSPEEQIILSLVTPRAPEKNKYGRETPVDYDKVMRFAMENGVASFLFKKFEGLNGIPEDIMKRLKTIYLSTLRNNILHSRETLRMICLLQEKGIDVIPVKGSLASDIFFEDIGLYQTGDIDLLVKPSDLERARELVMEAGYRDCGMSEKDLLRSNYHLIFSNGAYVLEVHWNLVMRFFSAPPEFWWEDTIKISYEDYEITSLSAERYLLYAIFHLFSHGFMPFKFFFLTAALLKRYEGKTDWEKLLSFAKTLKMKRLTLFTLRLLHDILRKEIPNAVSERKIWGYRFLQRLIISGIFLKSRKFYLRMLLYTVLLDTPLEAARVILRSMFPDPAEIRLRYGLSERSKMMYLYYAINSFLLLSRRR